MPVDYSQPLSIVARESTKEAHENAETSAVAKAMLRGELGVSYYVRYLMLLWHIYDTLERALDKHSENPVIEPTYNPALLARAPALSADISYFLNVSDWKSHPLNLAVLKYTTPYVQRLQEIADSADPSPLLAHAYVRYLGDLSGGQSIRHSIAKAYDLQGSSGLQFYIFNQLGSSSVAATQGEMKKIKDWFREGMDNGAGKNVDIKVAVSKEAIAAFHYTTGIFNALSDFKDESLPLPTRVATQAPGSGYSVAQVAAVIAAAALAHFILVVGGFTGEGGYAKWLNVEDRISSLFTVAPAS